MPGSGGDTPIDDLTEHACINLRLPTRGGLYVWEFEKGSRVLDVRVERPLVVNPGSMALRAALGGLGLSHLPEARGHPDLEAWRLVRVLADGYPPLPGYHLYYPSRRQSAPPPSCWSTR